MSFTARTIESYAASPAVTTFSAPAAANAIIRARFCNLDNLLFLIAFTITLPASPSAGDEVHVLDATASFDSNNLTVGRNSKKIQGATADLTITTQNTGIGLVFYNDTYGWRVLVDAYDVDVTEL